MPAQFTKSDTDTRGVANVFKTKYGKFQKNYLNRSNPFNGRIKYAADATGNKTQWLIDGGYIGGAGAGTVPMANRGVYIRPEYDVSNLYITAEIERKSWKLSQSDAGAWAESKQEQVRKVLEKFQWLRSFARFGPGDGSLGTIDSGGVTDSGGGAYSLVISAATFQRRRFLKREIVNIGAGSTDKFEITSVTPSTRTVAVRRIGGSTVPVAADKVFLQGAENNMPTSLREIAEFTTGSQYGVAFDESDWSPTRINASSATINVDMLNELYLEMHQKSGKGPTAFYVGYTQMRKLLNSIEDRKNYITEGSVKNREGDFSFSGLKFLGVDGIVPILLEPHLYDSELIAVVEDEIVVHTTPDSPDWVEDGKGNMLFLKGNDDAYEMRYASYEELTAPPIYVGQVYSLAT